MDTNLIISYAVRVVGVIAFFLVGNLVAKLLAGWVGRSLRRAKVDATVSNFARSATRAVLMTLVVISCLGAFGIETTSFAAVIGAAGLAIGLAFQGTLSSIASGVLLLVLRPFEVGQVIKVAGQVGKVEAINLFTVTLDTADNRRIILPNKQVFDATIENISFHSKRRVDVDVGVEYGADVDAVRAVLAKAAEAIPNQVDAPAIVLIGLGASSVDWQVRVWIDADAFWPTKELLIRSVKHELDAAGIGIPFPQMDVHLDGGLEKA